MKTRSVIGPVVLVLIGALFLLNNFRPDLVSWGAVARYWPLVLIVWGVLRLLELLMWRVRGAALPARGVSGGEWALVVIVCLIGAGMSAVHRHSVRFPSMVIRGPGLEIFGESFDFPVSKTAAAVKVSRVVIEIPRGNTRITGADVQEIRVEGRKTIRAFERSEAEDANRNTPLDISTEGEQILIRVRGEEAPHDRRVFADLAVTVPRGVSIQASGRYGDFDIANVDGNIDVRSGNAGVRADNIGGRMIVDLHRSDEVRATNVKGSVEVTVARGEDVEVERIAGKVTVKGQFSGDLTCRGLAGPLELESDATTVNVEKVPGELRMNLREFSARNVSGPLRISSKSRDVRIEDFAGPVTLRLERGHVELSPRRAPGGEINVATQSGDVDLTLPASAGFQLSASTEKGEIENSFGTPLEVKPAGRGAELGGSVGQGPRIRISTGLGSIRVGKG